MNIIKNPHDKFFKEIMSDINMAKDFISNYLPKEVVKITDLDTLKLEKDSFVEKYLKEIFSDILYKAKINGNEGYIYLLFEHKSYPSSKTTIQLLKYILKIWEDKTPKSKKLPMILPLVVYHGKKKWNIPLKLSDEIEGYNKLPKEVIKYIPDYEYLLYDLSKYNDDEIKGTVILQICMKILRDILIKGEDEFTNTVIEAFKVFDKLENQEKGIEYLETFITYIMSGRQSLDYEKMKKIASEISEEGSEVVMTIAEKLIREGMEKGMEKGRQEGRQEGIENMAKEAIRQGADIEFVAKISGLSKETLEKIENEIKKEQN